MNPAQDEYDELFREKDRRTNHPEDDEIDRILNSPAQSDNGDPYHKENDSDYEDEDRQDDSMARSRHYLPALRGEANTGPKGVIADAHAFEQAKRNQRYPRSYMRQKPTSSSSQKTAFYDEKNSDDGEDDDFMHKWRQTRLRELQKNGRGISSRSGSRRASPERKYYGNLTPVDGHGYLDAIEKAPLNTVVVVFIYDHMSEISSMVEDCLRKLARTHASTRFVKLHYEDAEMEVAGVPAVLAYKGAEKFAGLVPVMDEFNDEDDLTAASLEKILQRHQILF